MKEVDENLEERKVQVAKGTLYTELNTILRRISRRFSGEPTSKERDRIAEIKRLLKEL